MSLKHLDNNSIGCYYFLIQISILLLLVICSVQLTLDEQYDVTWHIPDGKRNNPLFSTNAFDLDEEELELMGSVDGSSYVFEV